VSSIKRRSDRAGTTVWRAYYRDPAGRQRNRSFARKIDAERFLTSVESSKLTGTYIDPARAKMTVGEVAALWQSGKVNLKATTQARYAAALTVHIEPHWKDVPLDRVEHSDVQDWIASMAGNGLSGASVRKAYGVFAAILDRAVRDRRLPSNPARGVDLPIAMQQRRKYLTARQVEALAQAAAKLPDVRPRRATDAAFAQYKIVVLVLAYCGLRWSEMAALRIGRVDLMRRRLEVAEAMTEVNGAELAWGMPKSHERRSVPIPKFIAEQLIEHIAGKDSDELMFTAPGGGVLRNRNARRAWFDAAADAIGEKGLTPHELRHTAASLAVSAGANVKAVQRMLGHKSAAMTLDVYSDLFDDDLDAVAERLDVVARAAAVAHLLPKGQISDLEPMIREAAGL
jgi:integrase